MRRRLVAPIALAALAVALILAACGDDEETSTSTTVVEGCEEVEQPPPKQVNLRPPKEHVGRSADLTAIVDTSCGRFTIALDARRSPKTVSSFVQLVEEGVYDDTTFHSVIPDFAIQGGDPTGTGTGGPGYTVDERPPQNAEYTRGVVAMARSPVEPPGRSGSQFFVVTAVDAGITRPDYALLGKVSAGEDTVDRIESLGIPGSETGTPGAPVLIRSITIRGG